LSNHICAGGKENFTVQNLCKPKDKLVYIAYLDDSCEDETHQIIAATIVHDQDFLKIETFFQKLVAQDVPEELRDSFEFHASALFHSKPPFNGIERDKAVSLLKDCAEMVAEAPVTVVYGAVDLPKLRSGVYATAQPVDIAFRLCIPEIERWFKENAPKELGIFIADDTKNHHQKENLMKAFRANRYSKSASTGDFLLVDTGLLSHIHDDMYFGDSRYSKGLQVADVCCFIILRHLQGKEDTEFLYKIIEPRIFSKKVG
jgi:hypothetical protein